MFGSCKSIFEKYSIFQKCYFPKRKMFSCVWLHFKKCFEKYFLMFGCVLENSIENTFSHFLTFSWLPNDYIISFIHQNTNKTQKKIIKSRQTKARSRSERSRSAWSWSERSAHRDRRRYRDRCVRAIAISPIGALRSTHRAKRRLLRSRSRLRLSGFDDFFLGFVCVLRNKWYYIIVW